MASHEEQDSLLLQLPAELLETIVKVSCLDHVDVCHLECTCSHFAQICRSNDIWRCKMEQRWPKCYARMSDQNGVDWHQVFQNRLLVSWKTRRVLREIAIQHYDSKEISDEGFREFDVMIEVNHVPIEDILDEVWSILHDGDSTKNLCLKFYGRKAARYLRHLQLQPMWEELLQLPLEQQSLEKGAIMVAQWCQPAEDIDARTISGQLDRMANMVREDLASKHPHHPLLSAAPGSEVKMKKEEEKQILECLSFVLYSKLGFAGDRVDYYNRVNSFIDKILQHKKGIPISLCILYLSVAKRLGVLCEPVNCPKHFLLRWLERPLGCPNEQYMFIDCFDRGRFLKRRDLCPVLNLPSDILRGSALNCAKPREVFERMMLNLVMVGRHQSQQGMGLIDLRNSLDLFLIVNPREYDMFMFRARLQLHFAINLPSLLQTLQEVEQNNRGAGISHLMYETQALMQNMQAEKKPPEVKKRKDHPNRLSVGLVMKHKRYNYHCVIAGWDPKCKASNEWITQMGVDSLPGGRNQPFYNVLVEDASDRYAAEENLLFTHEAMPIDHPDIGRYFDEFVDGHYIPNEKKQECYPDDLQETQRLLDNFRNGRLSKELCAD